MIISALTATTHNMSIFVALYTNIFACGCMGYDNAAIGTIIVNVRPRARIKYNLICAHRMVLAVQSACISVPFNYVALSLSLCISRAATFLFAGVVYYI